MPDEVSGGTMTLDVSGEVPLVEAEADEEILLAKDLTTFLIKAIKAFRFYPPDQPSLKGFREELPKKFQLFLDRYHSFVLRIDEYTLSSKGRVLYENRDPKNSLAFRLFKDGLRELRFIEGLTEWEIWGLIDITTRSFSAGLVEDDWITLMWERDFVHIGYSATDEFLEEMPVLIPESIEQYRNGLAVQEVGHDLDGDLAESEGAEKKGIDGFLFDPVEEVHPFASNPDVYTLTSDDSQRLRKEVESELAPTFMLRVIDTLFEILTLEKELGPYEDAAKVLDEVLDGHLTRGDFKKAGDLLTRVYLFVKTEGLADWQMEVIRKFIVGAGEEERIERIGRVLDREERVRLEDLSGYLTLLQRNSIRPLIKLLGEQKKSKIRRAIYDALAEIGKNAIEMFTPYLDDPRWYLVRNIVYILGRVGKREAFPSIEKAFHHEEFRVRREAVQSLKLIGGPEATELLVKALTDEDVRIRAMSAISLGKMGERGGLAPLLDVAQSKEFPKREPAEIKAFFDAIGMIGSNDSIPVLQELLEKKSWFGRGRADKVRIGAAQTLAVIGTPEASAILESGKDSKDEAIQEACYLALKSGYPNSPVQG